MWCCTGGRRRLWSARHAPPPEPSPLDLSASGEHSCGCPFGPPQIAGVKAASAFPVRIEMDNLLVLGWAELSMLSTRSLAYTVHDDSHDPRLFLLMISPTTQSDHLTTAWRPVEPGWNVTQPRRLEWVNCVAAPSRYVSPMVRKRSSPAALVRFGMSATPSSWEVPAAPDNKGGPGRGLSAVPGSEHSPTGPTEGHDYQGPSEGAPVGRRSTQTNRAGIINAAHRSSVSTDGSSAGATVAGTADQ